MAQYPHDDLPGVSTWRFKLGPNALQSEDEQQAHIARRKSSRFEVRTGDASWNLLEGENEAFQDWYRDDLNDGTKRFYIKLPAEHETGFLWHVARFVQKRVVSKGYGYHEVTATLEAYAIAGEPPVTSDVHWPNVLFLANGAGLLVDSSSYNRTLTSSGVILDNTYPAGAAATYRVPTNAKLQNGDANSICALMGSADWCYEFGYRYLTDPYNIPAYFNNWPCFAFQGTSAPSIRALISVGGFDIMLVAAVTPGVFSKVCFIRDNITHPLWTRFHLIVDNAIVATSTENVSKSAAVTSTGSSVMGFDINSPSVVLAGSRLTGNTRRYLTNAEGQVINSFVLDNYPYIVG